MKDNLKVREKLKGQSNERQFKSARDAKVTIEWKTIKKCARGWSNNQMKNNPKRARNAEVIIEWKTILKVRKKLK